MTLRSSYKVFSTAAAFSVLLSFGHASPPSTIERITSEQARVLLQRGQVFLLDVRTEEEHRERSIPGTHALVPVQGLGKALAEKQLDHLKNKAVLVYCRTGNRSLQAAGLLQQHGFSAVTELKGGIEDWMSRGFPVSSGSLPPGDSGR
jgi:rhodanese-related sulfurtransferase